MNLVEDEMNSDGAVAAAPHVRIRPINGFIGAEIDGIDLRNPLTEAEFSVVHDAFVRHEVIIIRDQDITLDQQMAFGRRFGKLTVHPFAANLDEVREVIVFENDRDNPPSGTDCWHTDETFREEPPMATILRNIEAPTTGGDTVFCSMTAAYRGLSERMKQYIHGLEALHDFKPWRHLFNSPELKRRLQELEVKYPNPWHPVVTLHPVSGRRVLYVNRHFTVRIKGLDEEESETILSYLYRQVRPEFQLRIRWEPNMIVMWDNRSTQHYASYDYYPQRRVMRRVTVAGDRPVGVTGTYVPEPTRPGEMTPSPNPKGGGTKTREFER